MKRIAMVASILLAVGCGKQAPSSQNAAATEGTAPGSPLSALPSIQVTNDDDEVLVTVGTHTLLRSRLEQDVNIQYSALRDRIPADQVDAFRAAATARLIEQFVVQTLLKDEAARRDVVATPEEEQQALEGLRARIESQGRNMDEALAKSPMGRERLIDELRTGLTIEKLVAIMLPASPEPAEQEVEQFIAENGDRMQRPERIHARRVFVAVDPKAPADIRGAGRQTIEKLRETLVNGDMSFEDAARNHSDCPSSARGGDLGWMERGRMGPDFDKAAFALTTGAISGIVESPMGFEIILVENHEDAQQVPREEVVDVLKKRSRQEGLKSLIKTMLLEHPVEYAPSISNVIPDSLIVAP